MTRQEAEAIRPPAIVQNTQGAEFIFLGYHGDLALLIECSDSISVPAETFNQHFKEKTYEKVQD